MNLSEKVARNNVMAIRDEVIKYRNIQQQLSDIARDFPNLNEEFITDYITEYCPRFAYYSITLKHKIYVPRSDYEAYITACQQEFEKLGHMPKPMFKNEDAIFKRLKFYKDNVLILSREMEATLSRREDLKKQLTASKDAIDFRYEQFLKYATTANVNNSNILFIRAVLYKKAMIDDRPCVYRECSKPTGSERNPIACDEYVKKSKIKTRLNINTGNMSDLFDDYKFAPNYIEQYSNTLTSDNDILIEVDKYELI